MPAYTSTQSGNFDAVATWGGGGYPSLDGDTFTIAAGHTVTYNIASPLANGFNDSVINGTLTHAAGTTQLRMNGTLTINGGGRYNMVAGSTLWINGSQADQHGVIISSANAASMTAIGTEAMLTTTLSSATNYLDTVLAVASAANFAVGDWIAIYKNQPASIQEDNDEGVIIHDIDTNNIYFRQFVTPTAVVSSYTNANLVVDNAKVFRTGQKIIVGTGANRNVKTISSINYTTNTITCDTNLSGTITGLTVYLTGLIRVHSSGEIVRKNASTLASGAAQGATSITLTDAANFDIGDDIVLQHSFAANGNVTWSTGDRHNITGKNGNQLTITPGLALAAAAGDFVTVWSRDCSIRSDTGDFGFLYDTAYSSNYNKVIHFKNTEFRGLGNSQNSFYRGVCLRSFGRTDFRTQGYIIEGCSIDNRNYVTTYSGFALWNNGYYSLVRNNVCWYNWAGVWDYYGYENNVVNNFILNSQDSNLRIEGHQGEHSTKAFNFCHRSNSYGAYVGQANYETGEGFHHNKLENGNQYTFYTSSQNSVEAWQNEFIAFRYAPVRDWSGALKLIYNRFTTYDTANTNLLGFGRSFGSSIGSVTRGGTAYGFFEFLEHNFEYDSVVQVAYHCMRYWDASQRAWRFVRRNDSAGNAGFLNTVYLPAGSTIKAILSAKLDPAWNGTQPFATIRSIAQSSGAYAGRNGDTNSGKVSFPIFVDTQCNFNSLVYTSIELTATNNSTRGCHVHVGLYSNNNNASEGWWQKPDEIIITPQYPNPAMNNPLFLCDNYSFPKETPSFTQKIIIGGTIR